MNLERMPNEEKLSLCRKYYLGEITLLLTCSCLHIHLSFNIEIYHSCHFPPPVTITNINVLLICTGGFAFLPFLWLVNVVWFYREAFMRPAYPEQLKIKTCEFKQNIENSILYSFHVFKFI